MSDFAQSLKDVPWEQMLPVVLLVIVGFVLWAAGHKVLRGGFAIAGLIIGGTLGLVLGGSMDLGVSPWVAAVAVGILAAILAIMAYRLLMIGALAVIFGLLTMLGVLAVHEFNGTGLLDAPLLPASSERQASDEPLSLTSESINAAGSEVAEQVNNATDKVSESLEDIGVSKDQTHESIEHIKNLGRSLVDALKNQWRRVPQELRPRMLWGGAIGAIVGLLVGGMFVKSTAVLLTAVGGSLLWLSGAMVIGGRLGINAESWTPGSGKTWLIVWLITALLGMGLQWTFRSKPADTPP